MPSSHRPRRLFQFSLRGLLFAVTALGVWLGVHVNRVTNQRDAVAQIERFPAIITYEYQLRSPTRQLLYDVYTVPFGPSWSNPLIQSPTEPFGPKALGRFLGEDFFNDVVNVALMGGVTRDEHLSPLRKLARLEALQLGKYHPCGENNLTDQGLVGLRGMPSFEDSPPF